MNKIAIVINGSGGVGKDTLCELAAKHFNVMNISSITPVKELAALVGWKGEKTDKARKFLADMKSLLVEYNDYPTLWAKEQYNKFLLSDAEVLFVHIREPKEIEKFVSATSGMAKTLLVRAGKRKRDCAFGNAADDCVENYSYDYYYVNDKDLETAELEFKKLIEEILK